MFNNKSEVFIDVLLLHSLFQKTSRRYLQFIVFYGMLGILIYSLSIEHNSLVQGDSFLSTSTKTTLSTDINELGDILTISSTTTPTSSSNISTVNGDNKDNGELSPGSPFYTSKNSILLNKLDLITDSNSNTSRVLQIFYEMGVINNSELVHNIGYYIEDSKLRTTLNQSVFSSEIKDSKLDEIITFAKGTGFYISADSDRVGWNAYDQVYDYSQGITKYLGVIYFSTNEISGGKLSDLGNKAGIYEYDLYPNGTAHRNMWLWPSP